MQQRSPKTPYKNKTDSAPVQNIDADLERLDISRLRLLIQKYPKKTIKIVKELNLAEI